MRIHTLNTDYFKVIDTEKKAYILGFFYADGYNNEDFGIIEFTQKECRIDILQKIKVELNSDVDIKLYNGSRAYVLNVCSKDMSQDLKKCGAPKNKAHILKFPDNSIVPDELIPHFIRGYFDGDGCI